MRHLQKTNLRYPGLWRGCVGAWAPCLGPTGLTLRDWSGAGNHCTLTNTTAAAAWLPLRGQYSMWFDGVNDYAVASKANSIPMLRGIYASTWINPANTTQQKTIFKIGFTGTAGNQEFDGLTLSAWSDGNIYGNFRNTTIVDTDYTASVAYTATLQHVAAWMDMSGTVKVYLNGVQSATTANASAIASAAMTFTQPATIGVRYDINGTLDKYFAGNIDDVRWGFSASDSIFKTLAKRRGIAYELAPRRRSRIFTGGFKAYWAARKAQIIGGGL